jgi:hypothetical protein
LVKLAPQSVLPDGAHQRVAKDQAKLARLASKKDMGDFMELMSGGRDEKTATATNRTLPGGEGDPRGRITEIASELSR